jgi:hypothetical protein
MKKVLFFIVLIGFLSYLFYSFEYTNNFLYSDLEKEKNVIENKLKENENRLEINRYVFSLIPIEYKTKEMLNSVLIKYPADSNYIINLFDSNLSGK